MGPPTPCGLFQGKLLGGQSTGVRQPASKPAKLAANSTNSKRSGKLFHRRGPLPISAPDSSSKASALPTLGPYPTGWWNKIENRPRHILSAYYGRALRPPAQTRRCAGDFSFVIQNRVAFHDLSLRPSWASTLATHSLERTVEIWTLPMNLSPRATIMMPLGTTWLSPPMFSTTKPYLGSTAVTTPFNPCGNGGTVLPLPVNVVQFIGQFLGPSCSAACSRR